MCRFWGFQDRYFPCSLWTCISTFRRKLMPRSSPSYQTVRFRKWEEQNVCLRCRDTSDVTCVASSATNVFAFVGSVGDLRVAVETGSPQLSSQGHSGLLYSSYPDMEKCSVRLWTWKPKEATENVATRHQHGHVPFVLSFLCCSSSYITVIAVWEESYVTFP